MATILISIDLTHYGMFKGQISMYFTPKHPIIIYTIAILKNGIQNGLCIGIKVYWTVKVIPQK